MNYSLAKELKDAGFPQDLFLGSHFYSKDGIRWHENIEREATYGDCKEPTLEELIEACGDVFWTLTHSVGYKQWYAESSDNGTERQGYGESPAEAVARLWLALNKK